MGDKRTGRQYILLSIYLPITILLLAYYKKVLFLCSPSLLIIHRNITQMPRRGKRFQPHMQRSGMWG
ncbi:hypothetical protein Barb4_02223 [Bacteroidales bacterium Barb4]|nr:hypothetical protein Barb4_02223 [Bacteroidales bacterium Barb4]